MRLNSLYLVIILINETNVCVNYVCKCTIVQSLNISLKFSVRMKENVKSFLF